MADGVQGDDEETFGSPLPPEDRLWRHPSELATLGETTHGGPWSTALVSAAGGAFVVGAMWLTLGTGGGNRDAGIPELTREPTESITTGVAVDDSWTEEVGGLVRSGTAAVRTTRGQVTIAAAVAVRDDGVLVTSGQAIGDATRVVAVDSSGASHDADVVGHDPATDVAVLRIDGPTTPVLVPLEHQIDTGDPVAVLGPDGERAEYAVAEPAAVSTTVGGDTLIGVVVLDTPLGDTPPGSPAIDETGAVIGVTTATDDDTPAAIVPIDLASDVATALIEQGAVDHPVLGITVVDATRAPTTDIGTRTRDEERAGARVTAVEVDGPAAAGGVLPDDIVVGVDGTDVDSTAAMILELRRHDPGDRIEVLVERSGERVSCLVELAGPSPAASAR